MTVYGEPGLQGLELWRGIARGATLHQLRHHPSEYFLALRDFLTQLHDGNAVAGDEEETRALHRAAGFTRVVFCGGAALDPALDASLGAQPLPFAVEIDAAGAFAAERGARHIFEHLRWQRGIALDLGQTQLKLFTPKGNAVLPRDPSQLPFGAHSIESSLGRARLRAWLSDAFVRATDGTPPDGVVLALPVELADDGVAKSSTYPGLFGPVQALFADLFNCPAVVINDAVLAALGFPPQSNEKTLVITIGFGVGGALWAK